MNISAINDSLALNSSSDGCNVSGNCSNNTTDKTSAGSFGSTLFAIEIALTCMDVGTLLSNFILIVVIYKATKLKDTPGRLLMNNVVSDGIVGASWLILYGIIFTQPTNPHIKTLSFAHRVIISILVSESAHTLVMVLFTLHLAICSPIRYKLYCRTKYVFGFLLISWVINIAQSCSVFFVEGIMDMKGDSLNILLNVSKHYAVYATMEILVRQVLPLLIIVICYIRICLHTKAHENTEVCQQSTNKTYIQQAKGILVITITFFITQLPLYLFEMLKVTIAKSTADEFLLFTLQTSFAFISYTYVVLKLPLFLIGFKSFRREFMLLCCKCCQKQAEKRTTVYNVRGRDTTSAKTGHQLQLSSTDSGSRDTHSTGASSSVNQAETGDVIQSGTDETGNINKAYVWTSSDELSRTVE